MQAYWIFLIRLSQSFFMKFALCLFSLWRLMQRMKHSGEKNAFRLLIHTCKSLYIQRNKLVLILKWKSKLMLQISFCRFSLPFILLIESIGFMVQSVCNPDFIYVQNWTERKARKRRSHTRFMGCKNLCRMNFDELNGYILTQSRMFNEKKIGFTFVGTKQSLIRWK